MTHGQPFTLVNGIKCYNSKEAEDYADYPDEGFDSTDKIEESSFWCQSRIRLLKKIVDKYSRNYVKARFLEIGSGNGTILSAIAKNESLTLTGSEIYLKGIMYAKQKLPNIDFFQFDVQQRRLEEKFDIIGAFDVLEHIENDVAAIININKMLNEGGYFILTVPQYKFLWSSLDTMVKHKRRYSQNEVVAKLEEQEFNICYCSSFLFVLFPLMLISRLVDKINTKAQSSENKLEKKVVFPNWVNWVFDKIMRIDEFLIEKEVSLPFGGSLIVVAQKIPGYKREVTENEHQKKL